MILMAVLLQRRKNLAWRFVKQRKSFAWLSIIMGIISVSLLTQ